MAFIIEALWWKREMIMKWWVGWFAANIWMTVLIFTSFYLFPSYSQNLPPSRWRYRWIIHESQLCIVWYFIIYVKFWWKVKWRWYRQIPWKETKVSCSCWSECILFRHSSTHSQVKLKTSSTCWKACALALWPQWATHCLKNGSV